MDPAKVGKKGERLRAFPQDILDAPPTPIRENSPPLATTVPVQVMDPPHAKSMLSALAGDEANTAMIKNTENTRVRFIKILPLFGYPRTLTSARAEAYWVPYITQS